MESKRRKRNCKSNPREILSTQQVSKFSKSRESSVTFLESTDDEAEDKKGKTRNHTNF